MSTYQMTFLFCICLLACNSTEKKELPPTKDSTQTQVEANPSAELEVSTEPTQLIVNLENLRLRESPGEKGKEISRLAKGTVLTEAGEISDFTTPLKLRGISFDEPWIKVKTSTGTEGWVYAGGVNFSMKNPTALANKLMEMRLRTLFRGLTPEILNYRQQYYAASDSEAFAKAYRKGTQLRDTMVSVIVDKITVGDYQQLPDLFWLEEAMPGFVAQLAAEGTLYYLFKDYQKMTARAGQTKGLDDDQYLDLCYSIHAFDSVEHFFPAWFLQTWDYGGSSLLGQGVHLRILQKMDGLVANGNTFSPEILNWKNQLIGDIVDKENNYWEPVENIKKELDQILAAQLSILTKEDIIALETRRKMFDDVQGNKIKVNTKNGM